MAHRVLGNSLEMPRAPNRQLCRSFAIAMLQHIRRPRPLLVLWTSARTSLKSEALPPVVVSPRPTAKALAQPVYSV